MYKSEGPARLEILHNNNNNINGEDDDDVDNTATMIITGKATSSLSAHDLHNANCTVSLFVHLYPEHIGGKVEMIEKDLWRIRQANSAGKTKGGGRR